MKYNELQIITHKSSKRVGRGIAAGQGKTAGRGTKGQKSRTGYSRRPGFEGGQNPLIQRLPKLRGVKSYKKGVETVSIAQIADLKESSIDAEVLAKHGLITNMFVKVKLIGNNELKRKVHVKLPGASLGAIATIKKSGGQFSIVAQTPRPK